MGERTGQGRVLVVADRDEIRTPISRALSAGGYQVDAVSSLTTTKSMDPAGYDVVLVETKLGSARSVPRPAPSASADAGTAAVWQLLEIVRRLRVREHGALAGLLHDDPIQELAVAALEVSLARRTKDASEGKRFDMLEQRVDAAGRSLRCLLDELCSFPYAESSLAVALERRTAWLLAAPLIVDAGDGASGLLASEVSVVADIVELILLGTARAEVSGRALASVRASEDLIFLELNLIMTAGTHQPFGDQPAVGAWLDSLPAATRIRTDTKLRGRRLRTRVQLPRQPHSPRSLGRRPVGPSSIRPSARRR